MQNVITKIKQLTKKYSFKIVIINILLLLLVSSFCLIQNVPDYDIWSRLIMGSHVVNFGSVMKNDIISYTPTHIWYDHEWLSSALMYIVCDKFGFAGATILKIVLCFSSILITCSVAIKHRKISKFDFLYIVLFCLALYFIKYYRYLRCQNFSYVFYPILLYILEKIKNNPKTKTIYFVPLMFILWNNMHGASLFGLFTVILYLIGSLIEKKPVKPFLYLIVICSLTYFINPWGVDFVKFMLNTPFVDRSLIVEWQSPLIGKYFQFPKILIYSIFSLVYIISTARKCKNNINFDWTKLLIFISALSLALKHSKFGDLFLITSCILLYSDFRYLYRVLIRKLKYFNNISRCISVLLTVSILCFSYFSFINHPLFSSWYVPNIRNLPLAPLQFIKDNKIKGNIFLPFFWGSLCAYKLYPDLKVFMDGRQEQVYEAKLLKQNMNFLNFIGTDSPQILFEYKTDIVLIPTDWAAVLYMDNQDYFKLVYRDNLFSLYLAPDVQKENYTYPAFLKDFNANTIFKTDYKF